MRDSELRKELGLQGVEGLDLESVQCKRHGLKNARLDDMMLPSSDGLRLWFIYDEEFVKHHVLIRSMIYNKRVFGTAEQDSKGKTLNPLPSLSPKPKSATTVLHDEQVQGTETGAPLGHHEMHVPSKGQKKQTNHPRAPTGKTSTSPPHCTAPHVHRTCWWKQNLGHEKHTGM